MATEDAQGKVVVVVGCAATVLLGRVKAEVLDVYDDGKFLDDLRLEDAVEIVTAPIVAANRATSSAHVQVARVFAFTGVASSPQPVTVCQVAWFRLATSEEERQHAQLVRAKRLADEAGGLA